MREKTRKDIVRLIHTTRKMQAVLSGIYTGTGDLYQDDTYNQEIHMALDATTTLIEHLTEIWSMNAEKEQKSNTERNNV